MLQGALTPVNSVTSRACLRQVTNIVVGRSSSNRVLTESYCCRVIKGYTSWNWWNRIRGTVFYMNSDHLSCSLKLIVKSLKSPKLYTFSHVMDFDLSLAFNLGVLDVTIYSIV
jgi:hypothetical protein